MHGTLCLQLTWHVVSPDPLSLHSLMSVARRRKDDPDGSNGWELKREGAHATKSIKRFLWPQWCSGIYREYVSLGMKERERANAGPCRCSLLSSVIARDERGAHSREGDIGLILVANQNSSRFCQWENVGGTNPFSPSPVSPLHIKFRFSAWKLRGPFATVQSVTHSSLALLSIHYSPLIEFSHLMFPKYPSEGLTGHNVM